MEIVLARQAMIRVASALTEAIQLFIIPFKACYG
jgi:hypothetical protein